MVAPGSCCSGQVSLKLLCPSRGGWKMSTAGGVSTVTLQWRVFLGKPYKPWLCFHSSTCPQHVPCVGECCRDSNRRRCWWSDFFFFAIDTWGRSTAGHDVQHILLVFQQDVMQERQLREIPKGITGKEAPQLQKQKVAQKGWLKWWHLSEVQRERKSKIIKVSELQGGKLQ